MTIKNGVKTPQISKQVMKAPEVNKNEVQTNWITLKVNLKKRFPKLTEQDLSFEEDKKQEMLVRIQNKTGKSKEDLQAIIGAF